MTTDRTCAPRGLLTAIGGLALMLGSAACSSTTPTAAAPTTSAAPTTVAGASTGGAFCQQYFAIIDSIGAKSFSAEGFQQFKASYQALAASVPAAIQSDVNSLNTTVQSATNVDSLPATSAAQTSVDSYVQANCAQSSTITTAKS